MGVQIRFFTASSLNVDSTNPMRAPLKVGWQVRTHCSVIRSPSKTGFEACVGIPAAEQGPGATSRLDHPRPEAPRSRLPPLAGLAAFLIDAPLPWAE